MRDAERMYDDLKRRRGEGMYTPLRKMMRRETVTLPPDDRLAADFACRHPCAASVEDVTGERVAWLCPDCDAQLEPGERSGELKPHGGWPPVRRVSR